MWFTSVLLFPWIPSPLNLTEGVGLALGKHSWVLALQPLEEHQNPHPVKAFLLFLPLSCKNPSNPFSLPQLKDLG